MPVTTKECHPFPNDKIKSLPNGKILQTTVVRFDKNGGKFSRMVENTIGNGEIARYEQSLLFSQCFQKTVLQTSKNKGLTGKGLTVKHSKLYYMGR